MKTLHQHTPGRPLTQLQLIFPRGGSFLDPPDLQGLSRITLRLMLMGAGGMSNTEFNGRLERLGAVAGFGLTNDHFTLRLLTLTPKLEEALELLNLALNEPAFDGEEFERLRAELISGWQSEREESKQLRAQEVYLHRSYGGGPQSYLADGLASGLRKCTLEDVRAQYKRLFAPMEPILGVLSGESRKTVDQLVASRLAIPAFADGDGPASADADGIDPWKDFTAPEPAGRVVTIVPDSGTNTDEVVLGSFSTHQNDPQWHLHRMITWIFGGDMNSRLFREVRGERGYSYGASCWYEAAAGRFPRNRVAPFTLYTFPSVEHSAQAVPLMISLYEQLVSGGVTEEEMALARSALINSHPFKRDSPEKMLALDMVRALHGVITEDDDSNRRKMEEATAADILEALREAHHPERMRIVLLGDPARLEPVAAAIPGVDSIETVRYP